MTVNLTLSEAKLRVLQKRLRGDRAAPRDDDSIRPRPEGARTPISAEQRRVWLHASLQPDLPLYNEPITIHRYGRFDLSVLEATFDDILRRHEAWRSSFAMQDGEVIQIVHPTLHVPLKLIDLTSLPPEARHAEAERLATEDVGRPIDLSTAPLFRIQIVRMAADDHRIYLTLHHIIFDGVSIYRILMPELAAVYMAFEAGLPSPCAMPELQYGDYALWRERHLAGDAVVRQMRYWRQVLAGPLPVLQLPTDRPRPARMSHRGSMETFGLSTVLTGRLREVSRQAGATLYMVLLAAFKAMLFRYTGQRDILVGGAADARRRPELEGVMGYFLDTLAMRTRPEAAVAFSQYLLQVREAVLGALANSDVPFDQIVQQVAPRRELSHHPIFQVFFSIEPPVAPFAEGWDLTQMDVTVGSAKFDLYLELDERPDHMAARFMYSTDLFDAVTIRRMAGHWITMLEAVCRSPDCPLGALPLLTEAELRQMRAWNNTARPVSPGTLHALVEQQAARTPDAPAVSFGNVEWSYFELDRRAAMLAGRLLAEGAGPGRLVAVYLDRSADMVAGLLAVLKTGSAYLPLDPTMPSERLQLCLDTASPVLVLTDPAHVSSLPQDIPHMLVGGAGSTSLVTATGVTTDLAYVIHTSGSTGRPKAVEITHGALVNVLESMRETPCFGPGDTLLAITTISFDIAALELFMPLISGGRVVVADRETARDPYLLAHEIERCGCTVMQATPSTWRALLATGWRQRHGNAASGAGLRKLQLLCGGEALTRDLAEALLARGDTLWNLYGPTETTIWSIIHRVTHGAGSVPVGRPIANTTAYVLDAEGQMLPIGIAGELHIGGAGLAHGYRGQPELTRERFARAAAAGDAVLYRTGDTAVLHADGTIECRGRLDNQVKVRGFRIELEEVEGALVTHEGVAAAAARIWPDRDGGARLAGYLVGRDGPPPDVSVLRRFLQLRLPDYMIPTEFVLLDALPLTVNGKTDRAALPAPEMTMTAAARSPEHRSLDPAACFDREEVALADIWAELLGVRPGRPEADFFDLGGHSLLVARLQHRIELHFGRRLSMAAIFHAPTLAQQAMLLRSTEDPSRLVPIQRKGTRPTLFWIDPPPRLGEVVAMLGPDQPVFGVALAPEDLDELREAPEMHAIAARHVRTIVNAQPSGPYVLAGLCTGGIVAYEVAVQLRAAGYEMASLVLLDSQNPVFFRRFGPLSVEWSRLCFYVLRALHSDQPLDPVAMLRRVRNRILKLRAPEAATHELSGGDALSQYAAFRYRPPCYPGTVRLLQAIDRPSRIDFRPGWAAVVTGELSSDDVNGHHEHLFAPGNIPGLSAKLAASLEQAVS